LKFNRHFGYSLMRFLFVIACIFFGSILLYYTSTVTYPFIIALLIAFLINPLVNFLERRGRMPRSLAVIIVMTLGFAVVAGLLTLLIAEVIAGSNYLAQVVPQQFETLVEYLEQYFAAQVIPLYNQITSMFNSLDTGQQNTIMNNIENVGKQIGTTVSNGIEQILKSVPNILGWLPNAATVLIFSLLATFFISKDWYRFGDLSERVLPKKVQTSGIFVIEDLKKALFGFIRAQFTLISITAIIVLIGLLFLQVEYAITIAFIIGFVDLLPYLGTGLIFVPWIIYSFFSENMSLGIGLSVLYLIVIVSRQVMEPKILSSSIGLDPLATLVALFVGFKIFGFLGLIIGPVALVIIKTLHHANVFRDIWGFIVGKNES
jgi:sporulation integral membrane protein YtvI